MVEVKKEKSIVRFYDNEVLMGGLDFATGEWIGKTNHVVKRVPQYFRDFSPFIASAKVTKWRQALDWYVRNSKLPNAVELLGYVERAAAVGLLIFPEEFTKEELQSISFDAVFVEEWKKLYNSVLKSSTYRLYRFNKEKEKTNYTSYFIDLMGVYRMWFLARREIWDDLFFLVQHNRLFLCSISETYSVLSQWVKYCEYLSEPIRTKTPIFIALDGIIKRYAANKDALLNDNIRKHNDKSYLYFEDNTYFSRPLLSVKEFQDEAKQQHNCVERLYMEKVAEGSTNVVVVRLKEFPDTSYITCEVKNNEITQWKAHYNNTPPKAADSFKKAYQAHILANA